MFHLVFFATAKDIKDTYVTKYLEENGHKCRNLGYVEVPGNLLKCFSEAGVSLGTFTENIQAVSEIHSCI